MKLILPTCLFALALALASNAAAQQRLFACDDRMSIYEIENYDTTPQPRMIPPTSLSCCTNADLGVRPVTGSVMTSGIDFGQLFGLEFDPDIGMVLAYASCWYSTSGGQLVSSIDANHAGTFFGHQWLLSGGAFAPLLATDVNPVCFTSTGLVAPANNGGDVAFDRDDALVSTRDGSTSLDRIDLATGMITPFGDPGIAFAGLEIDTDGTLYGLTASGALYRVDRSTFQPMFVLQLPPSGPSATYAGLAFREPAGRYDPTFVCTAQPNSTGQRATLRAAQQAGPAPGAAEFQAQGLPPQSFGILLVAPTTAMTPIGGGVLCLGSGFRRASSALQSDGMGRSNFALDLAAVPGHGAVQSGDQLYFQAWFRDGSSTGQATSNFTAALQLDFLF